MLKQNNNKKTIIKNTITAFCKDIKVFIQSIYLHIKNYNINGKLVRLLGFEPRTSWSVAKRSIQLSYRRIKTSVFLNLNYDKNIFLLKKCKL